jgi:hypothetical protein
MRLGWQKRAHCRKQLLLKQEGPNLITTGVVISGLGTVKINLMKNWIYVNTNKFFPSPKIANSHSFALVIICNYH